MSSSVYVTRRLPLPALDFLRTEIGEFDLNPDDRVLTRDELMKHFQGRNAVLCTLNNRIDGEVMDVAPGLKVLANFAVGYNNIDVAAATQRGIVVTNTPGVLTDATADLAWALLFSTARRIAEADSFMRSGQFESWAPMMYLGGDITGKTLGIVGGGRIGTAMGLRAKGFRMRVIYCTSSSVSESLEREVGAERVSLDELLQKSDFVSVHVSLSKTTHHLIGARELGLMKPTAYLVNTARGPVVDEAALVKGLRTGEIAGAGLDVFEDEPEMKPGLAELSNVVVVPHIGSATIETRTKMAMMAARNLIAVLRGETPPNAVNPEAL